MRTAKRFLLTVAGAMVATVVTFHAQQPASGAADRAGTDQPTFRAGVELVSVSVTVTDERGRLVIDLTEDDFTVFEDGRQRPIANFRSLQEPDPVPIGLGLVLDASGSMSPDKLASMPIAVDTLLTRGLDKEDAVYLMEFAKDSSLLVPWTTDRDKILNAIRRLRADGGTAIYDAIRAALLVSASGAAEKQVILAITDGGDRDSTINRTELSKRAWESGALIYALVVDGEPRLRGPTANAELRQAALELNQIAGPTGGQT